MRHQAGVLLRSTSSSSNTKAARSIVENDVIQFRRTFSGTSVTRLSDPSKYMAGVTSADLEKDPALAAFFAANYPDYAAETNLVVEGSSLDSTQALEEEDEDEEVEEEEDSKVPYVLTPEQEALNIRSLYCYSRSTTYEDGTRSCNRLREDRRLIPGLLYGNDPTQNIEAHDMSSRRYVKTPWNQIQRELDRYHRHFESRVYDLTIYDGPDDQEGTTHRVLPRDVQRHPVQNKVYCVNYLRYYPGRSIPLPILYINEEESPALKRGGFIIPLKRYIECIVDDGVPIPDHLELECAGVKVREVLKLDRIIFPEGVTINTKKMKNLDNLLIGTVFGKREGGDESGGSAGGAGEAAA